MKKIFVFIKKYIKIFLKGLAIGASMGVPGMSGGTTAIILKIYDKVLNALNTFFKNIKENFLFLSLIAMGGIFGFAASYFSVMKVVEIFPAISAYFFAGIILFGLPSLMKESGIIFNDKKIMPDEKNTKNKKTFIVILMDLIPFIAGLAVVVGIKILQNKGIINANNYTGFSKYLFFIFAGFFAGIAFVLPGLSFTYFLLLIGLIGEQGLSFSIGIWPFLIFIAGLIISIILTAKFLDKLIKKHKRGTYACIIGFLAGSVVILLTDPQYVPETKHIGFCILFFALSAVLILTATNLADKFSKQKTKEAPANEKNANANIETDQNIIAQ